MTEEEVDKIIDDISKTILPQELEKIKAKVFDDVFIFGAIQPDTQAEIDKITKS
jgi:hypothetical protein